MNDTRKLIHHRDIQNWVTARHGMPAVTRTADDHGTIRSRLALRFRRAPRPMGSTPDAAPEIDDGMSPISWKAWLAELDRQRLALRVNGQRSADFEFVERDEIEETDREGPRLH
jgi:hypothetical protein